MAQVFPTKSNLMAQKKSLALASQGYDLMDRKRNILVREMMQLIDRAATIQDEITTAYSRAYKALQRANITLGVVAEYAKTVPIEEGLDLDYRSVMGVELPIVKLKDSTPGLYYGLDSTNSQLDDVYLRFCEVKRLTVELAGEQRLPAGGGHSENAEARQCAEQHHDPPVRKHHQVHCRGAGRKRAGGFFPPEGHQEPKG